MKKIYSSLSSWRPELFSRLNCDKLFKTLAFAFFIATGTIANGQVLINPTTDGGFENGATFVDNGWTVVNNTSSGWTLGNTPAWFTGSRGAYFTNNLTNAPWTYSTTSAARAAFYKDVTFPSGPLGTVTLTFDWRANGNDGNYDNLLVYIANTNVTPTTSSPTGNLTTVDWANFTQGTTGYFLLQRNGISDPTTTTSVSYSFTAAQLAYLAGNTKRLIFVWKNDGSGGANPPASVDNISLSVFNCFAPLTPTSSAVVARSANFSWTAPSPAPSFGYQWEVRSTGAAGSGATGLADSGTVAAGTTAASSSLLTPNTTYTFYVRSSCNTNENSGWAASSTFTTPLSCYPVTGVTAVATSPTSANLSWTAPVTAPSSGYQWEVRSSGLGGSGTTGLIDSGSTVAGIATAMSSILTQNSVYTLYVRSNCGTSDFSTWAASSTFRTPCVGISTFPWTEGFETASATVGCFSVIDGNNDSDRWGVSADYPRSGSRHASLYTDFNTSNNDYLVTPQLILDGTAKILKFWVRARSTSEPEEISVMVSTTGSAIADFTNISMPSTPVSATTYYQMEVDLSSFVNSNIYIAFVRKNAPADGYYLYLDDLSVENLPLDLPDYVGLQFPQSATVVYGNSTTVYTQVYESGLTNVEPGLSGQAAGVSAWIGVSATNSDPSTWTNWTVATHNAAHVSNNDEYMASIGATLTPGTYYFASRLRLNGGAYRYGGIDASGNGNFWDGTLYNSGVLTVQGIPTDDCATALALTVGTEITHSNVGASLSSNTIPTCATGGSPSFTTAGKDVWFSLTVPANTTAITAETLSNADAALTDTGLAAYRGNCAALAAIICNDDKVTGTDYFSLLNLTNLTPGETIYFRVWGYAGSAGSFKFKTTVPTCGTETIWDGTAWSNSAPVAGVRAIFNGNYSGPGFEACSVNVNGTSQVVITSGSDISLSGIVTVASTASLTLSSNVNLLQSVTTSNSGIVKIQRESAPMIRLDHTLWSSPVVAQNLYAFSPNTLTNRFYVYDTATDRYVTTGLSATTNFAAAKGYAIRAANDHPSTATPWTGTFSGVPRNGSTSFTMTNAGNGFNLVGNPYPSVIDAAALVSANSARITGTLYFYAHTLGMLSDGTYPAGSNYALWNATGSTASTPGTAGIPANVPNGKINVGQGFIVKRSGTGDLSFTNAMREASHGNQFFRTADNNVEKHRVWLNLTNADNSAFSQMLVGYIDGATQAFDNLFDGESFGQEGSFIASKLDNKNFTIQGRALPFSDEDAVAMNFHAATAGNFTISLSQMDGIFAADQSVYIKDNQTGATHDLKASPYTFVSGAGDFDSRFQIVYRSALSTPEATFNADAVVAFVRNNALNIQTKNVEMKGIAIYDLRGRLLFENNKVNAENYVVPNFASQNQVILVKVTSQNNETVTVKVIF